MGVDLADLVAQKVDFASWREKIDFVFPCRNESYKPADYLIPNLSRAEISQNYTRAQSAMSNPLLPRGKCRLESSCASSVENDCSSPQTPTTTAVNGAQTSTTSSPDTGLVVQHKMALGKQRLH
jgi:hypothetical protein